LAVLPLDAEQIAAHLEGGHFPIRPLPKVSENCPGGRGTGFADSADG
jgi:hypothetical protein